MMLKRFPPPKKKQQQKITKTKNKRKKGSQKHRWIEIKENIYQNISIRETRNGTELI